MKLKMILKEIMTTTAATKINAFVRFSHTNKRINTFILFK